MTPRPVPAELQRQRPPRATRPGTVLDTPYGPLAVQGCRAWDNNTDMPGGKHTPDGAVIAALDDRNRVRFVRWRKLEGWQEVEPEFRMSLNGKPQTSAQEAQWTSTSS